MITFFNRETVYFGFDMQEFSRVCNILSAHNIKYKYKVNNIAGQNMSHRSTVRSQTGSFGMNAELQHEYELFVHKKDIDYAMQLVNDKKTS